MLCLSKRVAAERLGRLQMETVQGDVGYAFFMKATVEKTQAELPRLLALASQGEEVVITVEGQAVAKLTAVPRPKRTPQEIEQWLAELDQLRGRTSSGRVWLTVEQILEEDRGNGAA